MLRARKLRSCFFPFHPSSLRLHQLVKNTHFWSPEHRKGLAQGLGWLVWGHCLSEVAVLVPDCFLGRHPSKENDLEQGARRLQQTLLLVPCGPLPDQRLQFTIHHPSSACNTGDGPSPSPWEHWWSLCRPREGQRGLWVGAVQRKPPPSQASPLVASQSPQWLTLWGALAFFPLG